MSVTLPRNTALSGQHLVDVFVEDLHRLLEKVKSIAGTKRDIVTRVVQSSSRLQATPYNIDNLTRQLSLAVTAKHRLHFGISLSKQGENMFEAAIA